MEISKRLNNKPGLAMVLICTAVIIDVTLFVSNAQPIMEWLLGLIGNPEILSEAFFSSFPDIPIYKIFIPCLMIYYSTTIFGYIPSRKEYIIKILSAFIFLGAIHFVIHHVIDYDRWWTVSSLFFLLGLERYGSWCLKNKDALKKESSTTSE